MPYGVTLHVFHFNLMIFICQRTSHRKFLLGGLVDSSYRESKANSGCCYEKNFRFG